jgi:hypothetical protein
MLTCRVNYFAELSAIAECSAKFEAGAAEVLISRMDDDVESDKVGRSQNNGRQVLQLTCKQHVISTVHSQLVEF